MSCRSFSVVDSWATVMVEGKRKQPGWWWPRFRLRTFLAAVAVCSLWLGWRAAVVSRIDGAVRQLEESGCFLIYPYPVEAPEPIQIKVASSDGSDPNLTLIMGGGQQGLRTWCDRTYAEKFFLGYRTEDMPVTAIVDSIGMTRDVFHSAPLWNAHLAKIVVWIKQLPTVTDIDLTCTEVTGDCCKSLASLPQLRSVAFDRTDVGDEDLEAFALLTQVESLDLSETKWTKEGIAELQRRLPNCKIWHESLNDAE